MVGTVTDVREHANQKVILLNPPGPQGPGGKPHIVGVGVTDKTKYEGKAKRRADVKKGDRVTIQFERDEGGVIASLVKVDPPAPASAPPGTTPRVR